MATSVSLAGRAILALILLVGFYLMALTIAGLLLGACYLMVVHGGRIPLKFLIFCIAGAGIILWSILPRFDRFTAPGPRLEPEDQPRLFAEVNAIADAAGQAMPREVYLVPDVNAWVGQRGGIMGLGSRRVMGLGLPLMQVLTRSELRAVLAHEFGHYHGGDTALGPWIYKTRAAIGRTLQGLGEGSLLQAPFRGYAKIFLRLTHAISRRQEYAADALAAELAGSRALVSGLRAVHSASVAFQPYWSNELAPALGAGYRPPFADGFGRFLRAEPVARVVGSALQEELDSGKVDPYDTHPPLRDRIAAVGDLPTGTAFGQDPPAISLLDGVADLEAQLLASMFGAGQVGALKPVRWEEVGGAVYQPMWESMLKEHAAGLSGLLVGDLPNHARDLEALGRRIGRPTKKLLGPEEAAGLAQATVGASLIMALLPRGWTIDAGPGDPVTLRRQGQRLEPFNVLGRLAKGELSADDWRQQAESLGIADLDLGRVAGSPIEIVEEESEA